MSPSIASAAESASKPQTAEHDDASVEVDVQGERAEVLPRVVGFGSVVTAQDIERARPVDASEMLRRLPGVQVREDHSAGLRFDVGVRGLDPTRARRVLVLEDGVPLASNPYAEPEVLLAPAIERARGIELVRGAGNVLYGPGTIGGVMNFVTIMPPARPAAVVALDAGDYGFVRALARYGDGFDGGGYTVQAFHSQGDGFREDGFAANDAFGKIVFETSSRGRAILKAGFRDERATSTEVGLPRSTYESDPRRITVAPDDWAHARRLEISLFHDQEIGANTSLHTLLYAYEASQFWRRQDYDRFILPGVEYDRIVGDPAIPRGIIAFRNTNNMIDRVYDVAAIEPRIEHRFATGALAHRLSFGLRVLGEGASRGVRQGETPTSDAGASLVDEGHETLATSFFVEDHVAFRHYLRVAPGVRVEHASYRRELRRNIVAGTPADVGVQGSSADSAVIPGVGMALGPSHAELVGGVFAGFAPPRATTAIGATGQDQHLGAERSVDYELGARLAPGRWMKLDANGFLTLFQNQIIPAAGSPGLLANAGQTRHMGIESSARLGLGDLFGWGVTVDLGGSYAFSRARFENGPFAGNLLPYSPLHSASAVFDVIHPVGLGAQVAWTHVGAQYADSQNTIATNASGSVGLLPAFDIIDVNARYRHGRTGISGSVSVKSLGDPTYVASRRPDGIFTGAFRQILVGLRWESL